MIDRLNDGEYILWHDDDLSQWVVSTKIALKQYAEVCRTDSENIGTAIVTGLMLFRQNQHIFKIFQAASRGFQPNFRDDAVPIHHKLFKR